MDRQKIIIERTLSAIIAVCSASLVMALSQTSSVLKMRVGLKMNCLGKALGMMN